MNFKKTIIPLSLFLLSFGPVYSQDDLLDETLKKGGSIDSELDDLEKNTAAKTDTAATGNSGSITEGTDFDKLDMLEKEVKPAPVSSKKKPPSDELDELIPEKETVKTVKTDEVDEAADESDMEDLADTRYERKIAKFYRGKKRMADTEWKDRVGKSFEEVYVVVSGDTLWGISEKFLDSPWYWPKIWELNSYLTNPHKIEPGQEIRFKFSAEEGPSITLIPGNVTEEIKEEKVVDYSVLEQDTPASLFDKSGFFKEGLKTLNINPSSGTSIGGGEFYFDNDPDFLGELYAGKSERSYFVTGDEIELRSDIPCTPGKMLSVMEKVRGSIFSLTGDIKLIQETTNKMCKARVEKVFAPLQRNMKLVEQISVPYMESRNDDRVITGRIVELSPTVNGITRNSAAEGDRIFVRFNNQESPPIPGTIIYLYEIKDPITGREIDPHVIAVAKLVHTSGRYATADVVASSRALSTDTSVTTRF